MQISIIDHGPLKAKVSIVIDGQSIAFPETSYPKLVDLMLVLGASVSEQPGRGESHWTLDIDPVREMALAVQVDHLTAANAQMSAELEEARFAFMQMSEKLQGEIDRLLEESELSNTRAHADALFAKDRIDTLECLLAGAVNERQAIRSVSRWRRLLWAWGGRD